MSATGRAGPKDNMRKIHTLILAIMLAACFDSDGHGDVDGGEPGSGAPGSSETFADSFNPAGEPIVDMPCEGIGCPCEVTGACPDGLECREGFCGPCPSGQIGCPCEVTGACDESECGPDGMCH